MANLSPIGVPLCKSGCGKPTWNKKPGEYCTRECKKRHEDSPLCKSGCGKPTWNKKLGEYCTRECKKKHEHLRSQAARDGQELPQQAAVVPVSRAPKESLCKICKKPPQPGKELYGAYCGKTCRERDGAEHLFRICMWCHAPGPQCQPPPGFNRHARWCQRCIEEYNEWRLPIAKSSRAGAGLLFSCIAMETQEHLLLFNKEHNKEGEVWCHAHGMTDDGDKDNLMAACREGAEETCYALGTPRDFKIKYYDQNKMHVLTRNLWLVDLGELDARERELLMTRFKANLTGAFGRPPTPCEMETLELRWCNGKEFLDTVERRAEKMMAPSLGTPFRSFLSQSWNPCSYPTIVQNLTLRSFCMGFHAKGRYLVVFDELPVNEAPPRSSARSTQLPAGTTVEVVEVLRVPDQGRVRARIVSPAGWISKCMADGSREYVTQVPVI